MSIVNSKRFRAALDASGFGEGRSVGLCVTAGYDCVLQQGMTMYYSRVWPGRTAGYECV